MQILKEVIIFKEYQIYKVSKQDAKIILNQHHYLSQQGYSFKSGYNYGLYYQNILIGVIIFTGLSVPETAKGCFGLNRNEQDGLFELSRLSINPMYYEKNLTSWFVSRAIKILKHETHIRAILSYADSDFHNGYIYQATNFKYYGLTKPKKDFWILQEDGTYKKHQRGKIKGLNGEWRYRSRKHRYLLIFDKSLKCLWIEQSYPKGHNKNTYNYIQNNEYKHIAR